MNSTSHPPATHRGSAPCPLPSAVVHSGKTHFHISKQNKSRLNREGKYAGRIAKPGGRDREDGASSGLTLGCEAAYGQVTCPLCGLSLFTCERGMAQRCPAETEVRTPQDEAGAVFKWHFPGAQAKLTLVLLVPSAVWGFPVPLYSSASRDSKGLALCPLSGFARF